MQYPTDSSLREAIESGTVTFSHLLEVDWDDDGNFANPYSDLSRAVVSASTDQQLSGALPADYTLVDGTAAGELQVELSGYVGEDDVPVALLFSPYNSNSPLYTKEIKGRRVRYSILVVLDEKTITVRQFTGKIRRAQTVVGDWTVNLSCLDSAEDLLGPAQLPTFAAPYHTGTYYEYNSHWVIDQLLRAQGFSYTPLERDDVAFYVSLHGGAIPTHGWNYYETVGPYQPPYSRWQYPKADEGMCAVGNGNGMFQFRGAASPLNITRPDNGHTVGISCRVYDKPSPTGLAWDVLQMFNGWGFIYPGDNVPEAEWDQTAMMILKYDNGAVKVNLRNVYNGGTLDRTVTFSHAALQTGQWNWVQAEVEFNATSMLVRCWINGVKSEQTINVGFGTYHRVSPYPNFEAIEWPCDTWFDSWGPISDVQVYHGLTATTANKYVVPQGFTPTSILEGGMNSLTHNAPEAEGAITWDVLRDVVNAEYGSLFADEYGVIRFRNRQSSMTAKLDEDKRLDGSALFGISMENATDNVVNVVTATVKPMHDSGRSTTAWEANDDADLQQTTDFFTVPANSGANPDQPELLFDVHAPEMTRPIMMGRNAIPNVHVISWLWATDNQPSLPTGGWAGVQSGTDTEIGPDTVVPRDPLHQPVTFDVWLTGPNTYHIATFNFNNFAVQLANGRINSEYTKESQGPGDKPRRFYLRLPGFLRLWGLERNVSVQDLTSIGIYGQKQLELDANPWHQSHSSVESVARTLLNEAKNPVPIMDEVPAIGDPRVQLGDTIKITDPFVVGEDLKAVVSGIRRSVSADNGIEDTYVLRLVAPPAHWVLGDAVYSLLGETTTLS